MVELADGDTTPENISPALCRAAIRQVAGESAEYDFKGAAPSRRPRIYATVFILLAVLVSIPFLLFPDAGWNTLSRWFKPLSNVARYTFVRLEDMPDEQIIEVHATGRIYLNGREFGSVDSHELPDLVGTLSRYLQAADASRNKAMVTIWAEDEAKHQRVIDVMNACADAGIENVTFTSSVE